MLSNSLDSRTITHFVNFLDRSRVHDAFLEWRLSPRSSRFQKCDFLDFPDAFI
jgi:hypothetical protein